MKTILTFYLVLELSILSLSVKQRSQEVLYQFRNGDGIELIISNIRKKTGIIKIGMYNSDKGFPHNPAVSFSLAKDTISSGILRFFIPIEKPGSFSFSILDDENSNGKMDYFLRIIPKEGFGFSNNPKISGKAPQFSETSFYFSGGLMKVLVKMVYI